MRPLLLRAVATQQLQHLLSHFGLNPCDHCSICGALTPKAKHGHTERQRHRARGQRLCRAESQGTTAGEERRGQDAKEEQNNRDERNHLPHLTAQHKLPWAESSSGTVRLKMIPGIAAVSEFEVQVVGRIKCWLPRGVEDVCKCSTSNNPWQMHSFVTAFPPQSWREPHNITQWLWHW